MSKICDRNYKGNAAYTVKQIDGIGCCPLCEQPTACHGQSIEYRALFWALNYHTGVSSTTLARHMSGHPQGSWSSPPSDADDRSRCIRVLNLVPEWIPRLQEMVKYDSEKKNDGFIINSSGIGADHNTWAKQIPLIMQEGKL